MGYFFAVLIGLSLGLLGGGGSILTVPILVYVMEMDPKLSIALSLAIVGVTSMFGVFGHFRNKNVNFKIAFIFAPIAMLGTFLGAKISQLLSGQMQLLLFSIIMLAASVSMLKDRKDGQAKNVKLNYPVIATVALIVGILTGIVGVGGGFLIVPALVLLTGASMKESVGTSLLIISLNSFSGFAGYLTLIDIPWDFLLKFSFFSALGIFIGAYFVKYIHQKTLKKVFGVFLLLMGLFILYQNRATFMASVSL